MVLNIYTFNALKQQALKSFSILPSLAAELLPNHQDFDYFQSDLPDPLTLPQELELWKVHWCDYVNNVTNLITFLYIHVALLVEC